MTAPMALPGMQQARPVTATPGAMTPTMGPQIPTGLQPLTPGAPQTGGPTPGTSTWGAPGAQLQAFGPGNDMRFQSITPTDSANTQTYNGYTNTAAEQYDGMQLSPFQGMQPLSYGEERGMLGGAQGQMQGLNFQGAGISTQQAAADRASGMMAGIGAGGFGGGGASANTSRFNSELDGALQGLEGPDRAALAAKTMALLEERSQSGFQQAQRDTGQRAAALGRLGSGMTTNDLTGVLQSREDLLDRSRRDLAIDAAGQTLNDRLNVANMQRGIAGDRFGGEQFNAQLADAAASRGQQGAMFGANLQRGLANDTYGMGRDTAGMQRDLERDQVGLGERQAGFTRGLANDLGNFTRDEYGAGVQERDTARRDEFDRFGLASQRLSDFANLRNGERINDSANRDELRGERGYQDMQARRAIDDEYRRADFEEGLRSNRGNRAMGTTQLGFGGNSPGAFYENQAGQAQQNANGTMAATGDFLAQYFASQNRRG